MKISLQTPDIRKSGLSLLSIFLLTIILLNSCSSSNEADTLELFSKVPADAEFVAVANLEQIAGQADGKVKSGKLVNPGKLKELFKDEKDAFILDESSGINWSSAVIFSYQGSLYATCLINDAEALRNNLKKQASSDWKSEGDLEILGKSAISGDRLWVADKSLDGAQIQKFMKFSDAESFNSNEYSKTMAESDDALNFWGSIDALLNTSGASFATRSMTRMALGMFFKDPQNIAGAGNFKKGALTIDMTLLNGDMKPADCELELSTIDVAKVAALDGNANMVFAMAVSEKLVKQLLDAASSMGGAMPQVYANALTPLDGTIAFATPGSADTNIRKSAMGNFRATVTTNGKDNAMLLQMLQSLGDVKIDGHTFNISSGSYGTGALQVKSVADSFKGATLGMAIAAEKGASIDDFPAKEYSLLLIPDNKNLKIRFIVSF